MGTPEGKIAMLLPGFPDATFILDEVCGLRRKGVRLRIFSVRKSQSSSLSAEVKDIYDETTSLLPLNIWAFLKAHLFFALVRPYRYFAVLAFVLTRRYYSQDFVGRQSRFRSDRLRSLAHFCEGVYLANLMRSDKRISHIHAHYASQIATLAMVASRLLHLPFSFTAHAYDIWYDKLFLEEKVRAARFVVTCSGFGKSEIIRNSFVEDPDKIVTVYHGVDTTTFVPRPEKSTDKCFTILTVGRLSPEKSQKDLIHACKRLKDLGYIFRCNIVGGGPLMSEPEGADSCPGPQG